MPDLPKPYTLKFGLTFRLQVMERMHTAFANQGEQGLQKVRKHLTRLLNRFAKKEKVDPAPIAPFLAEVEAQVRLVNDNRP